ncbi:MAG: hypothetical protein GXP13_01435 [Gammaproteobacteria bacterium]|nr:hypothetical protein [Gammaproteobacteria bacterium]
MNNSVVKKTWLSRAAIPLLVLILVAPMGSAWIAFKYFPDWVRTLGTSNFGTFIDPPVKFSTEGLTDVHGKPVPADLFTKNWTYVYFNSSDCDRTCFDHLMIIKNVRLSQGKEISRMKRLFVITSGDVKDDTRKLLENFPSLHTIYLTNDKQRDSVRKVFSTKDQQDPFASNAIFVVDPDAKVMMFYKEIKVKQRTLLGMEKESIINLAKGMQDDMSKLMRNSKLRK